MSWSSFLEFLQDESRGDDWGISFVGSSPYRAMKWLKENVAARNAPLGVMVGSSGAGKSSAIVRAAEEGCFSLAPIYILIADRFDLTLPWVALLSDWDALGARNNSAFLSRLYLLLTAYVQWLVFVLSSPDLPRTSRAFGRVLARFAFSPYSELAILRGFRAMADERVEGTILSVMVAVGRLQSAAVEYGRSDAQFFFAFDEIVALVSQSHFLASDRKSPRSDLYGLVLACRYLGRESLWSVMLGSSWSLSAEIRMWSQARASDATTNFSDFDAFPSARVLQTLATNGFSALLRSETVLSLRGRPLWVANVVRGRVDDDSSVISTVSVHVEQMVSAMRADLSSGGSSDAKHFIRDILYVAMLESGFGRFTGTQRGTMRPYPIRENPVRFRPSTRPSGEVTGSRSSAAAAAPVVGGAVREATKKEFAVFRGYLNASDTASRLFSVLGDGFLMAACDTVATDVAQLSPEEDDVFASLAERLGGAEEASRKKFELAVSWVFCRLGRRHRAEEPRGDAPEPAFLALEELRDALEEAGGGGRQGGASGEGESADAGREDAHPAAEDPCLRVFGGSTPDFVPLCRSVHRFDRLLTAAKSKKGSLLLSARRDVDPECLETEFHLLFRRNHEGKRVPATDFAVAYTRDGTSGPDVLFWARDRSQALRLVFVQAKSGETKLGPSFKTLDPALMFPTETIRKAQFLRLAHDPEVAHFFSTPVRVLFTALSIPEGITTGMRRWNADHPDQPVFAFQASAATMGSALWSCYASSEEARVSIPESGCDNFQLQVRDESVVESESVVLHPPVCSFLRGDIVPAQRAARFARGILGHHFAPHELQSAFHTAELIAFRHWPRPLPSEESTLASFFTATADVLRRDCPDHAHTTAESIQAALGLESPVTVNDAVILRTAIALNVQIRVIEHGIEWCFPAPRRAERSVALYRSWCHFYASPPVASLSVVPDAPTRFGAVVLGPHPDPDAADPFAGDVAGQRTPGIPKLIPGERRRMTRGEHVFERYGSAGWVSRVLTDTASTRVVHPPPSRSVGVAADGNCLVASLRHGLAQWTAPADLPSVLGLRRSLVDQMRRACADPENTFLRPCVAIQALESGRTVSDQLEVFSGDGVRGGSEFLFAFVSLFRARVELSLWDSTAKFWFSTSFGDPGDRTVHLLFHKGHYEFLRPLGRKSDHEDTD